MQNLYDYRDDPFDGCDFFGKLRLPRCLAAVHYPPASDAEYQQREGEIAHQVVVDLHSPDVIAAAEAEDQDICTVSRAAPSSSGTTNDADGQPDVLQELALTSRRSAALTTRPRSTGTAQTPGMLMEKVRRVEKGGEGWRRMEKDEQETTRRNAFLKR